MEHKNGVAAGTGSLQSPPAPRAWVVPEPSVHKFCQERAGLPGVLTHLRAQVRPSLLFKLLDKKGHLHGYQDMEDVIAHFERRRRLELRILREIIRKDGLILEAKGFAADTVPDCCLHIR